MRFSKERIDQLAESMTARLQGRGLLDMSGSRAGLVDTMARAISEELSVEDRLNAEIRELLKQHDAEFQRTGAEYQRAFAMVKKKLVQERGLVL